MGHAGDQSSADCRDADPGQDGLRIRPADRFGAVPDLPWTARAEMETGTGYLVMASHLPLRRITATVRFFRAVSAVRKQLATAEGLVGYTLRAKPLARDYWTLSVWEDDAALGQFMRTPPHVQVMTSLKPFMGPTKFVTWTLSAADGRPSMAAALEHLAAGSRSGRRRAHRERAVRRRAAPAGPQWSRVRHHAARRGRWRA